MGFGLAADVLLLHLAGVLPTATALYERARDGLMDTPSFHRSLDDPVLIVPLRNAARTLGYGLT